MRRRRRLEPFGIHAFHAFGSLEVQEVRQCGLAERQEIELDGRWEVAGTLREVRPGDGGSGADGRHHIGDQGQMKHLLDADAVQHLRQRATAAA